MSWQASVAVLKHSKARGSARLLMLCIANYAGVDGGSAFPSNESLCKDSLLSERNVRYLIGSLIESGELIREVRCGKGNTNSYRINLPIDGQEKTSHKGQASAPLPSSKRGKPAYQKGQASVEKGQASVSKGATAIAPELYEQKNSKERDGAQGALLPVPALKAKPLKAIDPRFEQVCKAIRTVWPRGTKCDIDGRDAKAINSYFERKPAFPGDEIAICIVFRSLSEGENLTLPVFRWIGDVDKYQSGPLNRFGDPLGSSKSLPDLREQARIILGGEPSPQLPLPSALSAERQQAAEIAARQIIALREARQSYEEPKRSLGRILGTMDASAIDSFVEGIAVGTA